MSGDKRLVTPLATLIATDKPAAISGVSLNDPEPRVVFLDVVVSAGAPHFVRAANEINAEPISDVRRVVQRLSQIVDATPDQDIQRPLVLATGAAHDPLRAFRRFTEPARSAGFDGALLCNRPQSIGRR